MLLHINGKFTMGKLKLSLLSFLSFGLNRPSLSISRCRSKFEADVCFSYTHHILDIICGTHTWVLYSSTNNPNILNVYVKRKV